jgi:excisionase family DNA binding protein
MTNPKILLSKKEAAELLSVSLRTLERLIRRRQIDVVQVGRRVLIPTKSLAAFAASGDGSGPGKASQVN